MAVAPPFIDDINDLDSPSSFGNGPHNGPPDALYPPENISARFDAKDADIVFRSCDNVLFKIHRINLETSTGGFPPSDFKTLDEVVPLTESSTTLELLFQYVYPMPQPEIESLPFDSLADLAEAAEKYIIYPAMYVCKVIMGMAIPQNALRVFAYAGRHDYKDLLTSAAPHLVGTPLREVLSAIPTHLVVPWADYHASWEKKLQRAKLYPSEDGRRRTSNLSNNYYITIMSYMAKMDNAGILANLTAIFGKINERDTEGLPNYLRAWQTYIEEDLKNIAPFSDYL